MEVTEKQLPIRNILFFDIETSGLNIKEDKILQISGFLYDYTGQNKDLKEQTKFDVYIDPRKDFSNNNTNFNLNISEDASNLHGITIEYLDNNLDKTMSLKEFFENTFKNLLIGDNNNSTNALGTYNGTTFDIPFLIENLKSIGYDGNEIEKLFLGLYNIDSYLIETKLTSRKLEDVYEKYTGISLNSTHNSLFDIEATLKVFQSQTGLSKFNEESMIQPILCTNNSFTIDSGGIYKDQPIINIGKYKGKLVTEVIEKDRNYMTWYWNNVVSLSGRKYLTEYLKRK